MEKELIDCLVHEIEKKLGDRPFYTIKELTSAGVFGTLPAGRKALVDGILAFIRVSPRRCVIPKIALIRFLKENLQDE